MGRGLDICPFSSLSFFFLPLGWVFFCLSVRFLVLFLRNFLYPLGTYFPFLQPFYSGLVERFYPCPLATVALSGS